MGFLSWFFPSPEDRVRKAKKYLERGNPSEARLEILDVDHPGAAAVLEEAENALSLANMEAAIQYIRLGDSEKSRQHMALAEQFHHGGHEEAFRTARREMREIRANQQAEEKKESEKQARRLAEINMQGVPEDASWFDAEEEAARDEMEARLALVVENYPADLRESVKALGAEFIRAVLDLDEGKAAEALKVLLTMDGSQPLVNWERTRAAQAVGDIPLALESLLAFHEQAGHHTFGQHNTAELQATLLVQSGDLAGAMKLIRKKRAADPLFSGGLYPQLLVHEGKLEEAEASCVQLVKAHPRTPSLYVLLATVREKADNRPAAKRALEASLEVTCCTPGKCGSQPPSLEVHRMLARLYLEDGDQMQRGLELAGVARSLVQRPTWDDVYLDALVAKNQGDARFVPLVDNLRANAGGVDPERVERVTKYLGAA